jgi:hypothetical protein
MTVLLAALLCAAMTLGAQRALASDDNTAAIVGSWIVQVKPNPAGSTTQTNLSTLTADGGVINSIPVADVSTGHGAWLKTGRRDFVVRFVHLSGPNQIVVTANVRVSREATHAAGQFLTVVKDASGAVLFSIDGTVELERIMVDR